MVLSSVVASVACSATDRGAGSTAGGNAGGAEGERPSFGGDGGSTNHAGAGTTGAGHAGAGTAGAGTAGAGTAGAGTAGMTGNADAGASSGGRAGEGGTVALGGTGGAGGSVSGGYWKPSAGTSWQWQLTGTIDKTVNVSVYDIDGFDNEESLVKELHAQGRKVICYLSVGSYEDWRPDAKSFPAAVLGSKYPGWPGERFVDIRAKALREIMAARFDLCKQKGFDGVEPDNMDVYDANSGFPLTEKDGIDYANWLASEAHARGLNIGQKNASAIAKKLEPVFDWALTEDCYDQGWCADVSVYVDHDKPVFMSEYTDTGVDFGAACTWSKAAKFSAILKGRDLDAKVQFCP
jgi:glycosyl hydrolase family 114